LPLRSQQSSYTACDAPDDADGGPLRIARVGAAPHCSPRGTFRLIRIRRDLPGRRRHLGRRRFGAFLSETMLVRPTTGSPLHDCLRARQAMQSPD
jgi:hypothetical protein